MKTLRPFGVTFTPKPGTPKSQWTTADRGVGNASIALFVNLMRGIAGTCLAVLPSTHIGSTANEMTGPKVIRDPRWRKQNQCVMNRQQSTSTSGKDESENLWFETRRFATLLTVRIGSIDLILRSARRARLEGEVVHSAILALC